MVSLPTAPSVHVPPFFARMRRVFGALRILMRDPGRLDQVLVFALNVNLPSIARAVGSLSLSPEGARILGERPRIDRVSVDFGALERLPDGTLGREYVRFLRDNGISPEPFEATPDLGDERAEYLVQRLRQTHDLWHVLTGYRPDVRGELLLQAFTFAQVRAPSALLIALLGSLRYAYRLRGHGRALLDAYRLGKRTQALPTFYWEEHWSTPVAELRERLACTRAAT